MNEQADQAEHSAPAEQRSGNAVTEPGAPDQSVPSDLPAQMGDAMGETSQEVPPLTNETAADAEEVNVLATATSLDQTSWDDTSQDHTSPDDTSPDDAVLTPDIAASAALFERVGLQAAISVSLLDRVDTKVVASTGQVAQVLADLHEHFKVVQIAGSIAPAYRSVYYDTNVHELYNDHHNGKRIRYKIRYRTYLSTDTTFFEVKMRNDSRRTVKHRIRVPWIPQELGEAELDLLESLGVPTPGARPTLDIEYNRMTLVGETERVTIDLGLTCTAEESWVRFDKAAIIEVKQPRLNLSSPAFRSMRDAGLRPGSISKYCVGVATCIPGVKTNRFKNRLRQLGALEMTA